MSDQQRQRLDFVRQLKKKLWGAADPESPPRPTSPPPLNRLLQPPNILSRAKGHIKEWTAHRSTSQLSLISTSGLPESTGESNALRTKGLQPSGDAAVDPTPMAPAGTSDSKKNARADSNELLDAGRFASQEGKEPSSLKGVLKAGASFTQLLLKRLPDFLEPNPVKVVFGLAKLIVEIKDQVSDNLDAVEEQIASISAQLLTIEGELDNLEWEADEEMRSKIRLFSKAIEKELAHLRTIESQGVMRRVAAVEENQTLLSNVFKRFDEARAQLQLLIGVRTFKTANTIEEGVKCLLLGQLKPSHIANHNFHPEGKKHQVLRRVVCAPGTRIRQQASVVKWANDPKGESLYWLFGPAGSGKSTIAYTIACRFETNLDVVNQAVLGASFFCSRQFEEAKHETRIIRTLAYQLAKKCRHFASALGRSSQLDSINWGVGKQMKALLIDPWRESEPARLQDPSTPSQYLLLIDALDEIEGNGGSLFLRALLDAIHNNALNGIKFFATSRPDPDVEAHIKSFDQKRICRLHDVPVEEARADVKTYLESSLPGLADSKELEELARLADGLFIVAATMTKRLTARDYSPHEQLQLLTRLIKGLSNPGESMPETSRGSEFLLDELYRQILEEAFELHDKEASSGRLLILHTLLSTTERTSASTAAALLPVLNAEAPPLDTETVEKVVNSLYAVLYTHNGLILSYHKSFPDFIFNKSRSKGFWCNQPLLHQQLTDGAFRIMTSGLKFNIANITSSFVLDNDNPDLARAVKDNVPAHLSYACRNWDIHLRESPAASLPSIIHTLTEFLQLRVLFWLEVMSLLKLSNLCEQKLNLVGLWLATMGDEDLSKDINEVAEFATHFSSTPASTSTPHLYISALATWFRDTDLFRNWRKHFPRIPSFRHPPLSTSYVFTVHAHTVLVSACTSKDEKQLVLGCGDGAIRMRDLGSGGGWSREIRVGDHGSHISSVSVSGDGRLVCFSLPDSTVHLWDVVDGREVRRFLGHTEAVIRVAFAGSDNSRIVSVSRDGTIRMWDTHTGTQLTRHIDPRLGEHGSVLGYDCVVSEDRRRILGGFSRMVCLWDGVTGESLKHKGVDYWLKIAISSCGDYFAVGLMNGSIRVWSLFQEEPLVIGPTGSRRSTGFDGEVKIGLTALAFYDGARGIASAYHSGIVRLLDRSTGNTLALFDSGPLRVIRIIPMRKSRRLLTVAGEGTISAWDVSRLLANGVNEESRPGEHSAAVEEILFSPGGSTAASRSADGCLRLWEVSTGKEITKMGAESIGDDRESKRREKGKDGVSACAFLNSTLCVVVGSADGSTKLWDVASKTTHFEVATHTTPVSSISISTDDRYIASVSADGSITVLDTVTGAGIAKLSATGGKVLSTSFSQVMGFVALLNTGVLRSWKTDDWEEEGAVHLDLFPATTTITALSRGGCRVAAIAHSNGNTVSVWDTSAPSQQPIELHGHKRAVISIALSGDGSRAAAGSTTGFLCIWDVASASQIWTCPAPEGSLSTLAFSPDSSHLLSGGKDGTIRLWELVPPAYIRQRLGLNFGGQIVPPPADSGLESDRPAGKTDFADPFMTGWIVTPEQDGYLLYAPLHARVPHSCMVRTFPPSCASIDSSQAALGDQWSKCYIGSPST